jgi:hypothetical protein
VGGVEIGQDRAEVDGVRRDQIQNPRKRHRRSQFDERTRAGCLCRKHRTRRRPGCELTTGGVADDRDPGEVQRRLEPFQGVDGCRHVRERARPAGVGLADAPVLDVPHRVAALDEVVRKAGHHAAVEQRRPEAAVNQGDDRERTGTERQIQLADLRRRRPVGNGADRPSAVLGVVVADSSLRAHQRVDRGEERGDLGAVGSFRLRLVPCRVVDPLDEVEPGVLGDPHQPRRDESPTVLPERLDHSVPCVQHRLGALCLHRELGELDDRHCTPPTSRPAACPHHI